MIPQNATSSREKRPAAAVSSENWADDTQRRRRGKWERGGTPTRLNTCNGQTVTGVMGNLRPCAVSEQEATPRE